MPLALEGKQLLEQQRAKTRQAIGNKFASAFGKVASLVLPSGEQPVLGQSGIPQFDDYQNRAVAEAKSMAEIQAAKQGFPSEEAKRAWIINYLITRFSKDPEFKNADPTKLPEWALRDDIKDPIAEIKAAKQKKEELKGQASLMGSAFTKASVKMPTDEEASADVGKIKLMLGEDYTHPLKPNITSASIKTNVPSSAPAPAPQVEAPVPAPEQPSVPPVAPTPAPAVTAPEPIIAPPPKPTPSPSAYAPAYMATAPAEPAKESTHPWLEGVNKSPAQMPTRAGSMTSLTTEYGGKTPDQVLTHYAKKYGKPDYAPAKLPALDRNYDIDTPIKPENLAFAKAYGTKAGQSIDDKSAISGVAKDVAENTRKIKADIAKKGLGSESNVEEGDMAKPVRVTNPYATSQYKFNNP